LKQELEVRGFRNVRLWSRGVDTDLFQPTPRDAFEELGLPPKRPVFLYVGRVAVEKNVEAFLRLDLPGTKVVVGDGPQRAALQARYPHVHFLGNRRGDELSRLYASSDVFVFPSRTDTFGLVILEALACGTPVAAYPVPGPLDVVGTAPVAALNEDLRAACLSALTISASACREFALTRTWHASAKQFLENLAY
jgi:glycosyltransferase involved in cell wall biosynthesis